MDLRTAYCKLRSNALLTAKLQSSELHTVDKNSVFLIVKNPTKRSSLAVLSFQI